MKHRELFDDSVDLRAGGDLAEVTLAVPAGSGVCLFSDAGDQPIFLVYGANLRSIVRRRLEEVDEGAKSRRLQLRPITARLWVRRTFSAFETQLAYFRIAGALFPEKHEEFFGKLKAWFIGKGGEGGYPFFFVGDSVDEPRGCWWGPFATRKSAGEYVTTLEDMFDLCRCRDRLAQAPNAEVCAYAQMNRCAAVCDGSVSAEEYRRVVDGAVAFLDDPGRYVKELEGEMKGLATDLQFERAGRVKERVKLGRRLLRPGYRWVRRVGSFSVISLQPGPRGKVEGKRGLERGVSPFIIGPGWVHQIEPFLLSDAVAGCKSVIDHVELSRLQESRRGGLTVEQRRLLSWTGSFLYRSSQDKGLYLRADEALDSEALAGLVVAHFSRPVGGTKKKPDRGGQWH